jgi:hypothetical protein
MLKHSFRLVKVVECGNLGYTSVVELATIPEKWINHSQYGRCRIENCEEVESHCGHGQGCFSVEDATRPIASIMERVQSFKKAGYKLIVWNE